MTNTPGERAHSRPSRSRVVLGTDPRAEAGPPPAAERKLRSPPSPQASHQNKMVPRCELLQVSRCGFLQSGHLSKSFDRALSMKTKNAGHVATLCGRKGRRHMCSSFHPAFVLEVKYLFLIMQNLRGAPVFNLRLNFDLE